MYSSRNDIQSAHLLWDSLYPVCMGRGGGKGKEEGKGRYQGKGCKGDVEGEQCGATIVEK